jgi:hypothetical protein
MQPERSFDLPTSEKGKDASKVITADRSEPHFQMAMPSTDGFELSSSSRSTEPRGLLGFMKPSGNASLSNLVASYPCFSCQPPVHYPYTPFPPMLCVDTYEDLKQSVSTIEREPERVPETTQHPKHNPNNNIENGECQIGGDIRS